MTKTGWQLNKSIVRVSVSDALKKLDRNGLHCYLLDGAGVPISASGLKQAAKVLDTVDILTEKPSGQTKTYSQLYDIVGRYSVSTEDLSEEEVVQVDGVVVARYKGSIGEPCYVESTIVFESSPLSAILNSVGNPSSNIQFNITSTVGGNPVGWSITSNPDWVTCQKVNPTLLTITEFDTNSTSPTRTGEIVLTQVDTNEIISISLIQETNLSLNIIQTDLTGNTLTVVASKSVASEIDVVVLVDDNTPLTVTIGLGMTTGQVVHTETISMVEIISITPQSDNTYTYSTIPN